MLPVGNATLQNVGVARAAYVVPRPGSKLLYVSERLPFRLLTKLEIVSSIVTGGGAQLKITRAAIPTSENRKTRRVRFMAILSMLDVRVHELRSNRLLELCQDLIEAFQELFPLGSILVGDVPGLQVDVQPAGYESPQGKCGKRIVAHV
jgi:hypothetical protein